MANLHVLQKSGSEVTVVAHVPIPLGNNPAGVPWRTATAGSGLGATSVLKDGDGTLGTISSAEKTQLGTGAVFEYVTTLRIGTTALANINAYLDAEFTRISGEVLASLQDRLGFWGYVR